MKKQIKKLSLHRETLRHLEGKALPAIIGGNTNSDCYCSVGCDTHSACFCSWTNCSEVCLENNGCSLNC